MRRNRVSICSPGGRGSGGRCASCPGAGGVRGSFFLEGEERVMFSPGCADMAGLVIAPRREDFERYTPELLEDLFGQVTVTPAQGEEIARRVRAMNVG